MTKKKTFEEGDIIQDVYNPGIIHIARSDLSKHIPENFKKIGITTEKFNEFKENLINPILKTIPKSAWREEVRDMSAAEQLRFHAREEYNKK